MKSHTVTRARAIRRSKRRGAALVEAVVAIPFFLIVFASIVFIGQSYSKKMQMMRESREKVWAYASTNCGTPGDSAGGPGADTSGVALGSESNGNNGQGVDTSQANQVGNAPHADVINKDLGSATITAESSVTGSSLIGGVTAKQASYRKVMCNEPPYDGDLKGAVSAAFHDITGW